jgi:hypothetical protein
MFTVVAIRGGIKSPPLRFRSIEAAMGEAETCTRQLALAAIVYAEGETKPRCIYERGHLAVCRCARDQPAPR